MQRKMSISICLLLLFISLFACSQQNENAGKDKERIIEKEAGDFVLKFVSEKDAYAPHEESAIYVQVKYIGPENAKVIEHGGFSPVKFEVNERNRHITLPYIEPMILGQTSFKREQWYTFPFEKSGEVKEDKFYQEYFQKKGFPKGHYTIRAVFTFMSDEKDKYHISDGSVSIDIGSMDIKVK